MPDYKKLLLRRGTLPRSTTQTRTEVGGSGGGSVQNHRLRKELEGLEEQLVKLEESRRENNEDYDSRTNGTAENLAVQIGQIEARIRLIQHLGENRVSKEVGTGIIGIGSVVTVKTDEGSKCEFTIQPKGVTGKNCITADSVMGKALIGATVGGEVTANPPKGPITWRILAVS